MRPKRYGILWLGVLLCARTVAYSALIQDIADLRVYDVKPSLFEYTFTSVVSHDARGPLLSLNHADGETKLVRVGETFGEYSLESFDSRTEQVFSKVLNRMVDRDAGVAVLLHVSGKRFALEIGVPLEQPGHVACLVSLEAGSWRYVQDADQIPWRGHALSVSVLEDATVEVSLGGEREPVVGISASERVELQALWSERKRTAQRDAEAARVKAEAERMDALEAAKVDAMLANPTFKKSLKTAARRRPESHFFVGTEYRYPTEYQLVPIVRYDRKGRPTVQPIVVPHQFETRSLGQCIHGP